MDRKKGNIENEKDQGSEAKIKNGGVHQDVPGRIGLYERVFKNSVTQALNSLARKRGYKNSDRINRNIKRKSRMLG